MAENLGINRDRPGITSYEPKADGQAADNREIISVCLDLTDKIDLSDVINHRIRVKGFELDLDFDLPLGLPEPTLPQLIVLAHKLDMRIVITGLRLEVVDGV